MQITGPASAVPPGTSYTYTVAIPSVGSNGILNDEPVDDITTLTGAAATITSVTTNDPGNATCTLTSTTAACSDDNASLGELALTLTVLPTAAGTVTAANQVSQSGVPYGSDSTTTTIGVPFTFTGFFSPVANPPTVNMVHAGQAIPIQFSLGGDQGLNILAPGYPVAQQVDCASGAPVNTSTETDTAGGSGLQYDAGSGTYTYVWKTSKASKGAAEPRGRHCPASAEDGTFRSAADAGVRPLRAPGVPLAIE